LLINLLSAVGVSSEFILVNYYQDYFLSVWLPSPFLFTHAIVKVTYRGKTYYVDPTWINRAGALESRAQPHFSHYLPIRKNATLEHKATQEPTDVKNDITTEITLRSDKGSIHIHAVYRRDAADAVRQARRTKNVAQLVDAQNRDILSKLQYPEKEDIGSLFSNVNVRVISDNESDNVVTLSYDAELNRPYQEGTGKSRVFKYYHRFNADQITQFKHRDVPSLTLAILPLRHTVKISSDLFIRSTPVTKGELDISNEYFSFSNRKTIGFRSVEVVSEYRPKVYGYIKPEELEKIKRDYAEINASNFGVGIIFVTLPRLIWSKWYLRALLILLALYLLSLAGMPGH
jgi:hypothetical protein